MCNCLHLLNSTIVIVRQFSKKTLLTLHCNYLHKDVGLRHYSDKKMNSLAHKIQDFIYYNLKKPISITTERPVKYKLILYSIGKISHAPCYITGGIKYILHVIFLKFRFRTVKILS